MSILRAYLKLVARPSGALRRDVSQIAVAERLDGLLDDMSAHKEYLAKYVESNRKYEEEKEGQKTRILDMKLKQRTAHDGAYGSMTSMFQSDREKEKVLRELKAQAHTEAQNVMGPPPKKPPAPKSIYLYGNVGVGKTFLMDMFYEKARNSLSFHDSERQSIGTCRMHFNSAMVELHQHMHKIEQHYLQKEKFQLKNPGKLAVLAARRRRSVNIGGHSFSASNHMTFSTTLERASKELFKLKTDKDAHLGLVCFSFFQVSRHRQTANANANA
jgi:predicted ATPase